MDIPSNLIQEVKKGNAVLFLGAGSAMGAKSNDGALMLSAKELICKLSDRFLGGEEKASSLATVAELAISESDLVTVQDFISELFQIYYPAGFHMKIPAFKWKSIYTTNYDLIVERSYQLSKVTSQQLVPIYSSVDRVDSLLKSDRDLAFVKLHGCITKTDEKSPPLILTVDQYVTHRQKRDFLFERFKHLGSSNTVIFVGHSLEDPDIRQMLHEIGEITESRPRFYAVMPAFSDMQMRLWESKRVTLVKGTFEQLLISLEDNISSLERQYVANKRTHEIERKFISNDFELTQNTLETLQSQLDYIHEGMAVEECSADIFYHGYSKGWGAIQSNYDIARKVTDEVISQAILSEEHERAARVELYLLSGSAGSGKSIILKKIAWDSSVDYEKICVYWSSDDKVDVNSILELAEKIGERIFVFIDKASVHVPALMLLISKLRGSSLLATIIVAERTNEWNMECKPLHNQLTDDFTVKYLYPKEIDSLITKLDQYKCLGVLEGKSRDVQVAAFSEKAGRQLLVALHEATMAKSFEEIIYDEYINIVPEKARLIYKTICVMNRIGVPVRAGIINRIHGVNFKEFKETLFHPLENIVQTIMYSPSLDYAYETRHPWIAEIVFTYSARNEDERFSLYMSLIGALDVGYSADRTAFRELVKYKSLSSLFVDLNKIEKIYDKAYLTCGDDDFFYQQRAIFNMRSSWRRFKKAEEFLSLAEEYGPHNKSIAHTWAELELARANCSTGLERDKFINKANLLAGALTGRDSDSSHGYDTLCKIALIRLEDALAEADDELITEATKKAEEVLRVSLQSYPDDEHLLGQEARLASLLVDGDRAEKALSKAFAANPNNGYIGSALSNIYVARGDVPKAKSILERLLAENPSDKTAHARMAHIFAKQEPDDKLNAEYHWQRSFTDGDANYVNQLWYARQLYINDKFDDYIKAIRKLKMIRLPPKTRNKVRGLITDTHLNPLKISGKINRKESTYIIIEPSKYQGTHFLHKSNCTYELWNSINIGSEIQYYLGFTFSGAAAKIPIDLQDLSSD